jgi:hypothetical protein
MVTGRIFKAFKHITRLFSLISGAASVYDWHTCSFKMISTHETMITELASAFIQNPILEEGEPGRFLGIIGQGPTTLIMSIMCVTIQSYAVLYYRNENVIFYQANSFMFNNV